MPLYPPAGGGGLTNIKVSAGTLSALRSDVTFNNSNGVSFGLETNGIITGTVKTDYLTTAMLSNRDSDFVHASAIFAGFNADGTIASSGITVSVGNYLTTAALSNHSHGNPQLNLTNLTGTTDSNSAGFTLSLSAAAPGGGGGATWRDWDNMKVIGSMNLISNITATAFSRGRPLLFPIEMDGNLIWNNAFIDMSRATPGSNAFTVNFALYTFVNDTQISRLASLQNVFSNTATASVSAIRRFRLTGIETVGSSLTPNHYIGCLQFSAAGDATASMNYSLRGGVTVNPPVGLVGPGSNNVTTAVSVLSSIFLRRFRGLYSATSATPPDFINATQVSAWTTGGHPYFCLCLT